MKQEMRIPPGETSHDAMISHQIASAVRYAEAETSIPIVTRVEEIELPGFPLRTMRPIMLRTTYLLDVRAIKYFPSGADPRADPGGEILATGLGRVTQRTLNTWEVWPGEAWPRSLYPIRVMATRGLAEVHPALRAAAIAACRDLYEGQRLVSGDDSMVNFLLQPYVPYGFG